MFLECFKISDVEPLVLCVRSKELIEHRKQIYTNAKKNLQEHAGLLARDHICEKVCNGLDLAELKMPIEIGSTIEPRCSLGSVDYRTTTCTTLNFAKRMYWSKSSSTRTSWNEVTPSRRWSE
jgi:hypothetical protein